MSYHGDFILGATLDFKFTTLNSGVPTTLSGTPVISAYPDNSTTEITAGITLTADFDSRTGLNNVRVVATSGNGYASGSNYDLVITTGTVGGASVVGVVVGSFSIEARAVNWNKITNATTTVNLSGTTVKTATDVETDTQDIQSRLPAALVSGRMDSSVGAMAANTLTASALANDAVTEIQTGLATSSALATVQADTDNIQTRLPAALSGDGFMKSDLKSIDDELTSGNNATLSLKTLDIVNDAGIGLNIRGLREGIYVQGDTSGGSSWNGVYIEGGADGLQISGDNGNALSLYAAGKSINAPNDISVSDGDLTLAAIASAVWANATRTLTSFGSLIADTVDAVWDELTSGHTTAGTTGKALTDAGSAGDPWGTALPGAYGAGTAGKIVGDNLNAAIDTRAAPGDAMTLTAAYDAAKTAAQVADIPTAIENADAFLKRDWTSVTGEAARSTLNALRKLRNRVYKDGSNLKTTEEDDTTVAYSQAIITDPDQEPFKELG